MALMPVNEESSSKRTRWLGPAAILVVVGISLWLLHGELRDFRYRDISRAMFATPAWRAIAALALTGLSYLIFPVYDTIALRYAGRSLPLRKVALSSFISYGLSHTLGFPVVTAGTVRYRFWSAWGLSTAEIAQAVGFAGVTFTLGMIFVTGLAFVAEPSTASDLTGLPVLVFTAVGVVLLSVVALYLVGSAQRRMVRLRGWEFPLPSPSLAITQLVVATIDWVLAGLVLFVLIPSGHGIAFLPFLGVFLIAQVAGQISHVPGGAGVFETLMLVLLAPRVSAAQGLASLVAFRAIYYLVPFVFATIALAATEIHRQRERVTNATAAAGALAARWFPSILPEALSAATLIGGVILLFSGATPSVRGRVTALHQVLPLGVIEISHIAGSIAGAGLLVLAWALRRRLDAAYRLTVGLLLVGIFASLLKGLDYEEAIALTIVLLLLLPSHGAFYRRAALTSEPFGPAWTVSIVGITAVTLWLGFFSYKHVQLTSELWFRFSAHGDAPRFLRASIVSVGALLIFALMRVLRHASPEPELPTDEDFAKARNILLTSRGTIGNLVLLRDKAVLFGKDDRAFLMYGVEGRSWVALGDPIGDQAEGEELAWKFREEADRHGGWTVFYEVGTRFLPLYIDLGLTLLKIGEEAVVDLDAWSLEGPSRRTLRRTLNDVRRRGVTFEMLPAHCVDQYVDELRSVSDHWLGGKAAREKGFSLGRFDPEYLSNFSLGIVRRDGKIVAFSNVWVSGDKRELSVDLMRHGEGAPASTMEYLFIELFNWGKENGYCRFNLGMAPLSGLQNRTLAPLWNRAGALLYRHGEHFYNFRGLRQYKQKFDPIWEPRYFASPAGLALPRILSNTAALIAGGLKGVVTR
jgi:phosphatidylglycerol lysyltransferase